MAEKMMKCLIDCEGNGVMFIDARKMQYVFMMTRRGARLLADRILQATAPKRRKAGKTK